MKIEVTVKPGARENYVTGNGMFFKVQTTKGARGGEANKSVCELIAEHFGVAPSRVTILKGFKSHKKLLELL